MKRFLKILKAYAPLALSLTLFFAFYYRLYVSPEMTGDGVRYVAAVHELFGGKDMGDTTTPPLGHPVVLAPAVFLGIPMDLWTHATFIAAIAIAALAVRVYTGKTWLALCSAFSFHHLLYIAWLRFDFLYPDNPKGLYAAANIQATILLASSLLILALAVRRPWAIGAALAFSIVARPILLPAFLALALVAFLWRREMRRVVGSVLVVFGAVGLYSFLGFGDAHLFIGDGAISTFHAGNYAGVPANEPWPSRTWSRMAGLETKSIKPLYRGEENMKERERRLLGEMLESVPIGHIWRGWRFRFARFLGMPHGPGLDPGIPAWPFFAHVLASFVLCAVLFGRRLRDRLRVLFVGYHSGLALPFGLEKRMGPIPAGFWVLVIALVWSGTYAFFSMVPVRYITQGFAFWAVAPYLLAWDIFGKESRNG